MPAIVRKFLELAATIVLILALIALVFLVYNKATNIADKGTKKMDNMEIQLDESDYTKYDGAIVSGSDVIAAIKYFQNSDPICITVVARGTYSYLYTDTSLQTESTENIAYATQRNDDHYINPNGKFLGEVIRDSSDNSIVGLTFTIQ